MRRTIPMGVEPKLRRFPSPKRSLDILRLVAAGYSNSAIARRKGGDRTRRRDGRLPTRETPGFAGSTRNEPAGAHRRDVLSGNGLGAGVMRGIPSRIPLRHALHLPTFSTIVPWVVVLSAVGAVDTLDLAVVATWLTIHTLTLLAAGTPLIVAKLILHWRGVQDLSILWLVVGGVMAGLVKGSLTAMAEWQLGLIESWPEVALWRSIGASVAAVWLLVLIAVARTGLSQLEASRQRLVRQNVAARLTAEPGYDIAHLDEPLEKVVSLRDEVAGHFRLPNAERIRGLVDTTIRPLSHTLSVVSREPALPRNSFGNAVSALARDRPSARRCRDRGLGAAIDCGACCAAGTNGKPRVPPRQYSPWRSSCGGLPDAGFPEERGPES